MNSKASDDSATPTPRDLVVASSAVERDTDNDHDNAPATSQKIVVSRRHHAQMLAIAFFVIAAAALLQVGKDHRVAVTGAPYAKLPTTCLSRLLFNADCPGCGLTRSFVYLAHGEWLAAWNIHRLGWLLATVTLLQVPFRIWALRRWPKNAMPLAWGTRLSWGLILLLVANWLVKLAIG